MKAVYSDQVNQLLRKYLKKGKLNEFERLVSYAELWGLTCERTKILQALKIYRMDSQSTFGSESRLIAPDYDESLLRRYLDHLDDDNCK